MCLVQVSSFSSPIIAGVGGELPCVVSHLSILVIVGVFPTISDRDIALPSLSSLIFSLYLFTFFIFMPGWITGFFPSGWIG